MMKWWMWFGREAKEEEREERACRDGRRHSGVSGSSGCNLVACENGTNAVLNLRVVYAQNSSKV